MLEDGIMTSIYTYFARLLELLFFAEAERALVSGGSGDEESRTAGRLRAAIVGVG